MLTGHPRRTANAADSLTPSVVLLFHFYDIGEVWQCQSGGKHLISIPPRDDQTNGKDIFSTYCIFWRLGIIIEV